MPRTQPEKREGPFTRAMLAQDLRALGVERGDTIFMHSSFKSLGPLQGKSGPGDAGTVIGSLEDCVGPDGLLMLPSFNLLDGGNEARAKNWNVEATPSTVGYITEYFRGMPGTFRSDHYSHSVAARGRGAEEIVRDHGCREGMRSPWDLERWGHTYGSRSPMIKAYDRPRGKILMMGVDYTSSTFCHVVEVTYWNERLRNDPEAEYLWVDRLRAGEYWDSLGKMRRGPVGRADCRLFLIRDYIDTLLEAVRDDPKRLCK